MGGAAEGVGPGVPKDTGAAPKLKRGVAAVAAGVLSPPKAGRLGLVAGEKRGGGKLKVSAVGIRKCGNVARLVA